MDVCHSPEDTIFQIHHNKSSFFFPEEKEWDSMVLKVSKNLWESDV